MSTLRSLAERDDKPTKIQFSPIRSIAIDGGVKTDATHCLCILYTKQDMCAKMRKERYLCFIELLERQTEDEMELNRYNPCFEVEETQESWILQFQSAVTHTAVGCRVFSTLHMDE